MISKSRYDLVCINCILNEYDFNWINAVNLPKQPSKMPNLILLAVE